jgi:hypothetical protein
MEKTTMNTRSLAAELSTILDDYHLLVKKYGYAAPPAAEAKQFTGKIDNLITAIRLEDNPAEIRELVDLANIALNLNKCLLPSNARGAKWSSRIPYIIAGSVAGLIVGSFSQLDEMTTHRQYYLHNRSFAIGGAVVGGLLSAGLFNKGKEAAIDAGVKYYNELFTSITDAIRQMQGRLPGKIIPPSPNPFLLQKA